jgi:hypothetical protein
VKPGTKIPLARWGTYDRVINIKIYFKEKG